MTDAMSGSDAASGDDRTKKRQRPRLMGEFVHPPGVDPESEEHSLAEMYAWRDADLDGQMTLTAWRNGIKDLLERGFPYGKIAFEGSRGELTAVFNAWRDALQGLPLDASPAEVYGAAPDAALVHLGY